MAAEVSLTDVPEHISEIMVLEIAFERSFVDREAQFRNVPVERR